MRVRGGWIGSMWPGVAPFTVGAVCTLLGAVAVVFSALNRPADTHTTVQHAGRWWLLIAATCWTLAVIAFLQS